MVQKKFFSAREIAELDSPPVSSYMVRQWLRNNGCSPKRALDQRGTNLYTREQKDLFLNRDKTRGAGNPRHAYHRDKRGSG